jgi:hypothetical protein
MKPETHFRMSQWLGMAAVLVGAVAGFVGLVFLPPLSRWLQNVVLFASACMSSLAVRLVFRKYIGADCRQCEAKVFPSTNKDNGYKIMYVCHACGAVSDTGISEAAD